MSIVRIYLENEILVDSFDHLEALFDSLLQQTYTHSHSLRLSFNGRLHVLRNYLEKDRLFIPMQKVVNKDVLLLGL